MSTKVRKIKNRIFIVTIFIVLFIILTALSLIGYNIYSKKMEKRSRCDEIINAFSYELGVRDVLIRDYEEIIRDERQLSEKQLSMIYGNLSILYVLKNDYVKAVDYAVYSTSHSEKSNDLYMKAWCMNNMANIFLQMDAYDVAQEAFESVLEISISNSAEKALITEYAKLNLADIYSKTMKNHKAEEILNRPSQSESLDEINKSMLTFIRLLINARISINRNDYKTAEKLLNDIDVKEDTTDEAWLKNIVITKMELYSELYICTNQYAEAKSIAKKYIDICDKNEYKIEKVRYLNNFCSMSKKYGKKAPDEYGEFLLETYPDLLDVRNQSTARFIMYSHKRSSALLEDINENMRFNIVFALLMFTALILIYLLINKLIRSNKRGRTDSMTQIGNRRYFDIVYGRYMRATKKFGVIFIDIDYFKKVNDVYGHEFGDIVLKRISQCIVKSIRKNDKVFRYGGEEFCILCKADNKQDIMNLGERLRKNVEATKWDNDFNVTISVGISYWGEGEDLIFLADKNMYKSKADGRNKVTG